MTIFQKNLQVLSDIQSSLFKKISQIQTNVIYDVFSDNNPANTNLLDNRTMTPVYGESAAEETVRQFQKYEHYAYYPYLFFFGLGNGILYKALLENQRLKKLIIFEPEIEMIYIVLNLVDFSEELHSGRLLILLTEDVNLDSMTSVMEESKLYIKTYDLHQLLPYYDYAQEEILRINKLNLRAIHYVLYALGNDPKDALEGVENFIINLPMMVHNPKLNDALKAIKNSKTAVIVSTGPSLSKQLPLLKEIAPYVTIICIDASFPILYKHGIKPDAVVSLERVITTSAFYKNVPDDFYEGIVFFVSALAHKGLLHSLDKGIVQLSMRPFGYMTYFGLDDWGYIGIGTSAANMAFEVAYHAKFENVVFIGQDLAYGANGKSHSENHIFGENEIHTSKEYIQIEGYGGGHTVATTSAWKSFLDFFERNIPLVNTQMNVINATEGGARIHGTIERPFASVTHDILATEPLKTSIVLDLPDAKEVMENIQKIEDKITAYLSYGQQVQKQIEAVFLNVAEYLKSYENFADEIDLDNTSLVPLQVLVAHIDTIKALLDDSTFKQLFEESYKSVSIQQEIENGPIRVMPENTDSEKKEKYFLWIKAHKSWLFFLAGAVHGTLQSIEKGKKSWEDTQCFISKVILKNNYLSGYLYNLYAPAENKMIEVCIDDYPLLEITADHPQPGFQILDEQNRHHAFLVELPIELFDDQQHTLILREKASKEILKYGYAKLQLGEADKIQGSVIASSDNILYRGWCKKVGSNEKQLVDIFIDEEHVDTVVADRFIPMFKYLHGDEKFGFEFIVPEQYFDEKEHTVYFTPVQNPKELENNQPAFILNKSDLGKQREEIFIRSLDNVDTETIKDLYCKNTIGFFVVERYFKKNYIDYLKYLMLNFPKIIFKAICFTVDQKKVCRQLFGEYLNFQIISPRNIYDLASEIEILSIDFRVMHEKYSKYQNLVNAFASYSDSIFVSLFNGTPVDNPALKYSCLLEDKVIVGSPNHNILNSLMISNEIRESVANNFWLSILVWAKQQNIIEYEIHEELDKYIFYFNDLIMLCLKFSHFKKLLICIYALRYSVDNMFFKNIYSEIIEKKD